MRDTISKKKLLSFIDVILEENCEELIEAENDIDKTHLHRLQGFDFALREIKEKANDGFFDAITHQGNTNSNRKE